MGCVLITSSVNWGTSSVTDHPGKKSLMSKDINSTVLEESSFELSYSLFPNLDVALKRYNG